MKNITELEVYLHELKGNIDQSNSESKRLALLMEQHQNDKIVTEDITEKAQVQVYVELVEVQDRVSNFGNIEVIVRLGKFSKAVKFSSTEQNTYIFDKHMEM